MSEEIKHTKSYSKEELMKDAFVIDLDKINEDSIHGAISDAKESGKKIVVIGNTMPKIGTPVFDTLMKSDITVLVVDDIGSDKILEKEKFDADRKLITKIDESYIYHYDDGDTKKVKFRKGGNNRKIKKRKKAKNGKNKK
jgi:hypothetical protein